MDRPHPFRVAAEAKDIEMAREALREDVELHSPIFFRGFEGREVVMGILPHVAAILEDLTYTDEAIGERSVVLRFEARVGDKQLEGVDYLTLDEDGLVTDLTVFMRPFSALTAFKERMGERLGAELPSS